MDEPHTVTILLTKYDNIQSILIYYLTGRTYTHASISIGEKSEEYFSFNFHGFCRESIEKHRKRGVTNSVSYTLSVSEKSYTVLNQRLADFEQASNSFRYTRLGVICCLLHIPFHWKYHYFCSQFVMELLQESQIVTRDKPATLYTPSRLEHTLMKNGLGATRRFNPV